MKLSFVLLLFVVAIFAEDSDKSEGNDLPLAEECNWDACELPNCKCSSTEIPTWFHPRDTPQFVTITFDDAVNINNIVTYRNLLYNRFNANGCPAGATFFVSHEYTNYQAVNELYNQGFEIALHSITHQASQDYWRSASYEDMQREFADQVTQMARFANIPADSIKGIRIPFLQMSGNSSFQMIANHSSLSYDSSWPTTAYTDPALWPYTLDYASSQDCNIPPCPTASIPGPWVMPMISWTDLGGWPCSMVDACYSFPDREDEEAWYRFILDNFERHYFSNRSPFPFFIHEAYLNAYPAVLRATKRFLDTINNIDDVYMVTMSEVLEWIKTPVDLPTYKHKECKRTTPAACRPRSCGPLLGAHNNLQYYMTVCSNCPRTYPWLGNPLGQ